MKLSKEQADWLISSIRYNFENYSKYNRPPNLDEISRVINQCTEKENFTTELWYENSPTVKVIFEKATAHIKDATLRIDTDGSTRCYGINKYELENLRDNISKMLAGLYEKT